MLGLCMHCRGASDVTISVARGDNIAHYASCWADLERVCARARADAGVGRPQIDAPRDAIDADSHELRGDLGA